MASGPFWTCTKWKLSNFLRGSEGLAGCIVKPTWVLMAAQGSCVRQIGRKVDLGYCFKAYCLATKSWVSLAEKVTPGYNCREYVDTVGQVSLWL